MKWLTLILTIMVLMANVSFAEIMEFSLQSSDTSEPTGSHGGRPYQTFDGPNDEAIYITASDWQGGHDPDRIDVWPKSDGFVTWDIFADPNGTTDRPPVHTYNSNNELMYLYLNTVNGEYELHSSPYAATETLHKMHYNETKEDGTLNFGNNGVPADGTADRQHALITEFKLERPYLAGMKKENLISAYVEITIDRVIDMTLSGQNMSLIPSQLFVNSFSGDGIINIYENVQADFDRIDHANADTFVWLTIEGTENGMYITDYSLAYYKLIDPGLGLPYSFWIDVTDSVLAMLEADADYAGFVFSGSADGEYTLASTDLVDAENYLPKLIITADVEPLLSDFDGNNKVDLVDFAQLSAAWLSVAGDSNFDAACDISNPPDGYIDFHDFELFLIQWLEDRNR